MLNEQEKERIRLEEQAKHKAQQKILQQQQQKRAAKEYRHQVRHQLLGKQKKYGWWLLLIPILVIGTVAIGIFIFKPDNENQNNENAWGGIADQNFVARCQDAIRTKLADNSAQFPNQNQTSSQITATSDGKRWDGFVVCPSLPAPNRMEFICSYTPQNDQLNLEIIKP